MIKGYTLLESVIVLLVLSVSMLVSVPIMQYDVSLFNIDTLFTSELICLQQQAYLNNKTYEICVDNGLQMKHELYGDYDGSNFHVTKLGRVNRPVTILANSRKLTKIIKVWLGMGRVHVER